MQQNHLPRKNPPARRRPVKKISKAELFERRKLKVKLILIEEMAGTRKDVPARVILDYLRKHRRALDLVREESRRSGVKNDFVEKAISALERRKAHEDKKEKGHGSVW